MRLGRNNGGEKNGIDRDPCAFCRLSEPDAPAEESVLGQGGVKLGRAQRSSSSAAAITAWARR
jgi:hypothetical protein